MMNHFSAKKVKLRKTYTHEQTNKIDELFQKIQEGIDAETLSFADVEKKAADLVAKISGNDIELEKCIKTIFEGDSFSYKKLKNKYEVKDDFTYFLTAYNYSGQEIRMFFSYHEFLNRLDMSITYSYSKKNAGNLDYFEHPTSEEKGIRYFFQKSLCILFYLEKALQDFEKSIE